MLHPEQIAVLSAHDPAVVENAVGELVHQNEMADWLGVDTLTIHGGGAYGDKPAALARLTETILKLPAGVRRRLALENDDRTFTPAGFTAGVRGRPACRWCTTPTTTASCRTG